LNRYRFSRLQKAKKARGHGKGCKRGGGTSEEETTPPNSVVLKRRRGLQRKSLRPGPTTRKDVYSNCRGRKRGGLGEKKTKKTNERKNRR